MNDEATKELFVDMLECSECADIGTFKIKKRTGKNKIKYMLHTLPGITYIRDQMINFMFSNNLTTGNSEFEPQFKKFLYRKNLKNTTNYDEIKSSIATASIYGECGLRWYEGNLYHLEFNTYAPLTYTADGVERVLGYVTRKDGKAIGQKDVDLTKNGYGSVNEFITTLSKKGLIFLDNNDFVNIRNDVSKLHGLSPFLNDQLRLDLLVKAYERLNYDVVYDGPGRIILKLKDGYYSSENNEVSTSEVMQNTAGNKKELVNRAKTEAKAIAKGLRNSSSDDVIVLSNNFKDEIKHLERVTKATEFLEWLSNEGTIVAQALGMSPSLVETGAISGNVSMEKILDNGMRNNIVPLRERYAVQFSEFITRKVNEEFGTSAEKVFFEKYQSRPDESKAETIERYVNMLYKTQLSIKDVENVSETYKEVQENLAQAINEALKTDNGEVARIVK